MNQTLQGGFTSKNPYQPLSNLSGLYSNFMGQKAQSPANNITPPKNTLSPSQVSKIGSGLSMTAPTSPSYTPPTGTSPLLTAAAGFFGIGSGNTGGVGNILANQGQSSSPTKPFFNVPQTNSTTGTTGNTSTNNSGTQTSLTSLPNGGQTTAQGGYAGSPSTNPNFTASTPTPPVVNQGYGNSVGGINSGGAGVTQAPGGTTATPDYAAGQGYTGAAPQGVYGQAIANLGNTQTPAVTNQATSNLNSQATGANPAQTNINTLTDTGLYGTPAVNQANQNLSNFQQGGGKLLNEIQSDSGLAAGVSSGIAAGVGQQLGTTEQALSTAAQNALTGQGQQISSANAAGGQQLTGQQQQITAANNAGNIANTAQSNQITGQYNAGSLTNPASLNVQVPYSNQYISSLNGQPVGGGAAGTLPSSAQSFVNSLAQQVQSGAMTRSDAESRLTAYGQPGLQALNSALGSNFNTNASNASAQTTATGQQIQTAATATNNALDTLGNLFNQLPGIQTGGIPATDAIANWVASSLGQAGLTQYTTALNDARSQLIGVLNASGGTPSGNEATAMQYLPDNMTVSQFNQLVGTAQNPGTARQLVQQKVSAFTNSGNQNSSGSSGVQYNSDGTLQSVSF